MGIQGDIPSDARLSPLKTRSFWRKAGSAFLRLWGLWLVGLALLLVPPALKTVKPPESELAKPHAQPPEAPRADLRELQAALERGDDPAILEFFRRRCLTNQEHSRVQNLIGKLADDSFRVRLQASEELTKIGPRAAGMLRRGTRNSDVEIAEQCRLLLGKVVNGTQTTLLTAALRRLESANLPGTIAVLFGYLPDAEEEQLAEAVLIQLSAISEGRPDSPFTDALTAPRPETRWAAAVILGNSSTHRGAVLELLKDNDSEVRYRTARALLPSFRKEVCRALIDLLPDLPAHDSWATLDILYQEAGVDGPAVGLGIGAAGRQRCRAAWLAWWNGDDTPEGSRRAAIRWLRGGGRVPLLRRQGSADREPTLLVQLEIRRSRGSIQELNADGSVKQSIDNFDYPVWAEQLANGLLLVIEYHAGRVSEFSWSGDFLWSVSVPQPVFAQRLPDGSTFIASRDALWKADVSGKASTFRSWPERIVATARPCQNGDFLVLTVDGTCIFLDSAGKEKRRFETGFKQVLAPGIDVTANNRVLVPDHAGGRVVEFSPTGEILWQGATPTPTSVQRLPNGNTLVASTAARQVIEMHRMGRVVWRLADNRSDSSLRPVAATRR